MSNAAFGAFQQYGAPQNDPAQVAAQQAANRAKDAAAAASYNANYGPAKWAQEQATNAAVAASGGGGGGGGAGAGGDAAALTSERNPDMDYVLNAMKGRLEGDGGAGQAITKAGGAIADFAHGQGKTLAAGRTRRGVSGTGVDNLQSGKLAGEATRSFAGAASDISLARERDKDAILSGIANVGSTQASIMGSNQDRALQLWKAKQDDLRAAERATMDRNAMLINLIGSAASFA